MAELTEEQEKVVRHLIAQGALIERERILEDLEKEATNGILTIAVFKLKNIINGAEETESQLDHEEHEHNEEGSLEHLFEVMFGFEHVVAEFFWNAVFVTATFFITKGITLRKAHKYIDSKHGVSHDEGY